MKSLTHAQWLEEGTRRFGPDPMKWKFVCPACKHVASVQDYKDAGAPENVVAFSCIGRYARVKREAFGKDDGPGPCNYAGGGLFRINPVRIIDHNEVCVFDFA